MKTKVVYSPTAYHTQKDWVNKTKVIHSRTAYATDRDHTHQTNKLNFIYPVVYSILVCGTPTFYWSNTKDNGHFGVPKVIWSWGAGVFIDRKGEYGLTQFAAAIVDEPENLDNIAKALRTKKFIELMKYTMADGRAERFNRRVIAAMRHDFWRDFL